MLAVSTRIFRCWVYFLTLIHFLFLSALLCQRQLKKVREAFVLSTLRQDISWFDENAGGAISTNLSDDCEVRGV